MTKKIRKGRAAAARKAKSTQASNLEAAIETATAAASADRPATVTIPADSTSAAAASPHPRRRQGGKSDRDPRTHLASTPMDIGANLYNIRVNVNCREEERYISHSCEWERRPLPASFPRRHIHEIDELDPEEIELVAEFALESQADGWIAQAIERSATEMARKEADDDREVMIDVESDRDSSCDETWAEESQRGEEKTKVKEKKCWKSKRSESNSPSSVQISGEGPPGYDQVTEGTVCGEGAVGPAQRSGDTLQCKKQPSAAECAKGAASSTELTDSPPQRSVSTPEDSTAQSDVESPPALLVVRRMPWVLLESAIAQAQQAMAKPQMQPTSQLPCSPTQLEGAVNLLSIADGVHVTQTTIQGSTPGVEIPLTVTVTVAGSPSCQTTSATAGSTTCPAVSNASHSALAASNGSSADMTANVDCCPATGNTASSNTCPMAKCSGPAITAAGADQTSESSAAGLGAPAAKKCLRDACRGRDEEEAQYTHRATDVISALTFQDCTKSNQSPDWEPPPITVEQKIELMAALRTSRHGITSQIADDAVDTIINNLLYRRHPPLFTVLCSGAPPSLYGSTIPRDFVDDGGRPVHIYDDLFLVPAIIQHGAARYLISRGQYYEGHSVACFYAYMYAYEFLFFVEYIRQTPTYTEQARMVLDRVLQLAEELHLIAFSATWFSIIPEVMFSRRSPFVFIARLFPLNDIWEIDLLCMMMNSCDITTAALDAFQKRQHFFFPLHRSMRRVAAQTGGDMPIFHPQVLRPSDSSPATPGPSGRIPSQGMTLFGDWACTYANVRPYVRYHGIANVDVETVLRRALGRHVLIRLTTDVFLLASLPGDIRAKTFRFLTPAEVRLHVEVGFYLDATPVFAAMLYRLQMSLDATMTMFVKRFAPVVTADSDVMLISYIEVRAGPGRRCKCFTEGQPHIFTEGTDRER